MSYFAQKCKAVALSVSPQRKANVKVGFGQSKALDFSEKKDAMT